MALGAPLLDFKNVSVMRGRTVALRSLTLRISAGENVALIGPNGSGKSTLIKTINRECYPLQRRGCSFRIFGQDIWNVFELRKLLGIVSNDWQDVCRRDLTGREVVLSGFFSSVGLWARQAVTAAMESKARRILSFLGVGHLAQRTMTAMSSGEARRMLIGRALAHDPKALILDEPSNSLDLRAMRDFRETWRRVSQSGTSIILATHELQDIIPEITRVVLLKAGAIFRDGPKRQVLTGANLKRLYGISIRLEERQGYFSAWPAGQQS